MKLEKHPFNDLYGLKSIKNSTKKLILGSFPAFQVMSKKNPRFNFYYGSDDNKFWDLYNEVFNINSELSINKIIKFLEGNDTGIIDIINKCYRNNNSSSDKDLSIIEFQNIVEILQNSSINTIYSTSRYVTKLLKQQLTPLVQNKNLKKNEVYVLIEKSDFEYEEVCISNFLPDINRKLKIKTLLSPSKQGLRGIKKGLNRKNINMSSDEYRLEQYKQLLK